MSKPLFFETSDTFHRWLEENYDSKNVLWVGFYKVSTNKPSISWSESVEVALCFGWIDGLRKSINEESYKIRFTPRKPDSHWSAKNIKTIEKLKKEGRMHPAGLSAFELMDEKNARQASYEQHFVELSKEYEDKIRENERAWKFFQKLAPGYTRTSVHWVMSAKREKTRLHRLQILIESCEQSQKIPPLQYGKEY
ncbi:MAG TPA: YdeI/OmpD-associated family protein [Balneolaceae bacterium]|nr:YdeI/OmpD-associated family protein [Balneolaceae bacterium]